MQADFSVELGRDDETLTLPWAAPEGGPRYFDLKRYPDLLPFIEEARHESGLGEFLLAVNSTILETAKCDAWAATELNPEEEIFGASHKFGSYVDFLFSDDEARFSFVRHEDLVKRLAQLLQRAPEIPAAVEFLVRRCYYGAEAREGFYVTCYVFGYGNDEQQARKQWVIALKLVEHAIRQVTLK